MNAIAQAFAPSLVESTFPAWTRSEHLADLADIHDVSMQICAWQRQPDPVIGKYLSGLHGVGEMQLIESLTPQSRPSLDRLPNGIGRSALMADLTMLVEMFCDLLDCAAVGLRLARVDRAMCPRWHIDRVGIRLLCTYQGPGTQWLDDQSIDRQSLRSGEMNESDIVQAATGDVVLLKGALWQGNESLGAIHRSPGTGESGALRTVITLDPLW